MISTLLTSRRFMKTNNLLFSLVVGSSVLVVLPITTNQKAFAQTAAFTCGVHNGVPTTVARTTQGDIPVIRWVSGYFNDSGYTPQKRCEEVSERFQEYHSQDKMKFLTTGRRNGLNIVCVAETNGGPCYEGGSTQGLLFTLKPTSSPGKALRDLMAIRTRDRGPMNETESRVYIDMSQYLQQATSESNVSDSTQVQPSIESEKPADQLW
jgi:hypothetical protein